jgi:16S rRNA (adenine1518-N6/adenine1519-N6)-dimethyltransferase
VGHGERVVEIGAGLGSLTLALAETGANVLAIEFDRALIPPLEEVTADLPRVRVLHADATDPAWHDELGAHRWTLCANLPYNVAVPIVLDVLEGAPAIDPFVVMVQREVGERLAAEPGDDHYGAVSVRVAYRARASVIRRVPPSVFWPRPRVDSVLVRLDRHPVVPVEVDPEHLWKVIDVSFAQRRKTMRNAVRRLGLDADAADDLLGGCGIAPAARPEELALADFAAIAERLSP